MLCQAPIITHTAATPQDSPNTTLEPGMRDFAAHRLAPAIALYSSTMSIDSIDRSTVSANAHLSIQNICRIRLRNSNNISTINNQYNSKMAK